MTSVACSSRISRRTARRILIILFAAIIALFAVLRFALPIPRFRYTVAAAFHGAYYLDERGVLRQKTSYDCGPASLAMVLASMGHDIHEGTLLKDAHTSSRGTTMLNLQLAAQEVGVNAASWQLTYSDLQCVHKPIIAFVSNDHFVVLDKVTPSFVTVRDPARGRLVYPAWIFKMYWHGQAIIFGRGKPPCYSPTKAS